MPQFDEKFLNELKNKNNLVDVASKYCVLKRNGPSNYWACCPLPGHSEKTPSFSINEPGQYYHCFGCGKGGDVIKFIEEVEGMNFYEAVKLLAENAKMELPEEDKDYSRQLTQEKNKKVPCILIFPFAPPHSSFQENECIYILPREMLRNYKLQESAFLYLPQRQ